MTSRARLRLGQASSEIGLLLSLVFVARWLSSGRSSYWLDEITSVVRYGTSQSSGPAMINRLSRNSIHPPLYQVILFYWMRLFGNDEVVTRFLSNLYVTGAALCLYLMVRRAAGRRRALMAATFFSLMYVPFYYAMETRSYGQTLFLSSLSSMALFQFMRVLQSSRDWKAQLRSGACVLLAASNLGLLLTHYYNVFFLAAQALFLLGWEVFRTPAIADWKPAQIGARIATLAVPLVSPLVLLLAIWGRVMARSYHKFDDQFTVDESTVTNPANAFMHYAVQPNFLIDGAFMPLCTVLLVLCAALLIAFYVEPAAAGSKARSGYGVGRRALGFYALAIAFVPFLVAYVLFSISGHQRYSGRYFTFASPALAIMIVLAIEQAVLLADRLTRRRHAARAYLAYSALFTFVVAIALVLPGTYKAVTRPKWNWGGTAKLIANIVREDTNHKYIVYSTWGNLDYYLARAGTNVRTHRDVGQRAERAEKFPFDKERVRLLRYDFLILALPQLPDTSYPRMIAKLNANYELYQRLLDDGGLGIIIYRIKPQR